MPQLRKRRAAATTPAKPRKQARKQPRRPRKKPRTEPEPAEQEPELAPEQLPLCDDAAAAGGEDDESDDECGWQPAAPWRALGAPPTELRLASTLMSGQSFRWERRLASNDDAAKPRSWRAQYPGDLAALGERALLDTALRHVEYVGPIERHLFVLRETQSDVFFRVVSDDSDPDEARDCLRRYLRLPPAPGAPPDPHALRRAELDRGWGSRALDPGLDERLLRYPGVRLLALPLREAVVSPATVGPNPLSRSRLTPLLSQYCFMGSANNNIKRNSQMVAAMCAEFDDNLLGSIDGTDYVSCARSWVLLLFLHAH